MWLFKFDKYCRQKLKHYCARELALLVISYDLDKLDYNKKN